MHWQVGLCSLRRWNNAHCMITMASINWSLYISKSINLMCILKTLDNFGNRPVFSLMVYLNIYAQNNNWSSKLRDDNGRRNTYSHTKLCAFRFDLEPSKSNYEVSKSNSNIICMYENYFCLSRKLRYFRGSRFSQCFILSTAPHWSLTMKFLC